MDDHNSPFDQDYSNVSPPRRDSSSESYVVTRDNNDHNSMHLEGIEFEEDDTPLCADVNAYDDDNDLSSFLEPIKTPILCADVNAWLHSPLTMPYDDHDKDLSWLTETPMQATTSPSSIHQQASSVQSVPANRQATTSPSSVHQQASSVELSVPTNSLQACTSPSSVHQQASSAELSVPTNSLQACTSLVQQASSVVQGSVPTNRQGHPLSALPPQCKKSQSTEDSSLRLSRLQPISVDDLLKEIIISSRQMRLIDETRVLSESKIQQMRAKIAKMPMKERAERYHSLRSKNMAIGSQSAGHVQPLRSEAVQSEMPGLRGALTGDMPHPDKTVEPVMLNHQEQTVVPVMSNYQRRAYPNQGKMQPGQVIKEGRNQANVNAHTLEPVMSNNQRRADPSQHETQPEKRSWTCTQDGVDSQSPKKQKK